MDEAPFRTFPFFLIPDTFLAILASMLHGNIKIVIQHDEIIHRSGHSTIGKAAEWGVSTLLNNKRHKPFFLQSPSEPWSFLIPATFLSFLASSLHGAITL
jgi:hypothetical protein